MWNCVAPGAKRRPPRIDPAPPAHSSAPGLVGKAGRQVTANGGDRLMRVEQLSRAAGGASRSLACRRCTPDCSSPEAPGLTRHGQAGGSGGRGGGELRGRWGPGARTGSWLETISACGWGFGRLPAAQHGDARQVSRALEPTASRCPAQGPVSPRGSQLRVQGRSGVGGGWVGGSSTVISSLPCPSCCPRTCWGLSTCSLPL